MSLASTVAAGAAALLILAPIASADDPPPCAPDDQQCQDQQKQQQGASIANQVIDNVQQGVDQAKQANEALNPKSSGGPGIMVLKDGVPWCMPLGQPLPVGAVFTSPTGNGRDVLLLSDKRSPRSRCVLAARWSEHRPQHLSVLVSAWSRTDTTTFF